MRRGRSTILQARSRPRRTGWAAVVTMLAALAAAPAAATAASATYGSAVNADAPKVYYQFNERSGATAVDSGPGGHSGTYTGAVLGQPSALTDGTTAVRTPGLTAAFTDKAEHTIEFWLRKEQDTTQPIAVATHGSPFDASKEAQTDGWTVFIREGVVRMALPSGTVYLGCQTPTDTWTHIGITVSPGLIRCYQDGKLIYTATGPASGNIAPTLGTFRVTSPGIVDELALYSQVLDAAAFLRHLMAGKQPFNLSEPSTYDYPTDGMQSHGSRGTWKGATSFSERYEICTTWVASSDLASSACSTVGTGQWYTPTTAQVGQYLRFLVTATNEFGSVTLATPSYFVKAKPPANVTPPSISGIVRSGELVLGNTGTWTGSEPITYKRGWEVCDTTETWTCQMIPRHESYCLGPGGCPWINPVTQQYDHWAPYETDHDLWIDKRQEGKYLRLTTRAENVGNTVYAYSPMVQVAVGDPCETIDGCPGPPSAEPPLPEIPDQDRALLSQSVLGAQAEGPMIPAERRNIVGRTPPGSAVLATGRVLKADGTPARGDATVFAIPINRSSEQADVPHQRLASTSLGPTGEYTLSSSLVPGLANIALYNGGVVNLQMLVATQDSTYTVAFIRSVAQLANGSLAFTDMSGFTPSFSTISLNPVMPGVGAAPVPSDLLSTGSPTDGTHKPYCDEDKCYRTAWDCNDAGQPFDHTDRWTAVGQVHTGDNFFGTFAYSETTGGGETNGSVFQIGFSDTSAGTYSSSSESTLENAHSRDGNNSNNPFPRNTNRTIEVKIQYAKQRQKCTRDVYVRGQDRFKYDTETKNKYRIAPQHYNYGIRTGDATTDHPTKNQCKSSNTMYSWRTPKKGEELDKEHTKTNSIMTRKGYELFGDVHYTHQFHTTRVTTGIRLIMRDGGPYRVCGSGGKEWDVAKTFWAGSFASGDR